MLSRNPVLTYWSHCRVSTESSFFVNIDVVEFRRHCSRLLGDFKDEDYVEVADAALLIDHIGDRVWGCWTSYMIYSIALSDLGCWLGWCCQSILRQSL